MDGAQAQGKGFFPFVVLAEQVCGCDIVGVAIGNALQADDVTAGGERRPPSILTFCFAAVKNERQISAMRFLIGLFEAPFYIGAMTLLGHW